MDQRTSLTELKQWPIGSSPADELLRWVLGTLDSEVDHFGLDEKNSFVRSSYKGAFPGVKAVFSRDLVHLIELNDLCLWLKTFVPMACFRGGIEVLLSFPYRTLPFQHNLIFGFLTWNVARTKISARLACKNNFRTFWRSLFEIWRCQNIDFFL